MTAVANSMRALVIKKLPPSATGVVFHDAVVETVPIPPLAEGQVLVRVAAAAFNHRDVSDSNLSSCPWLCPWLGGSEHDTVSCG
jgi:hypothetical protein